PAWATHRDAHRLGGARAPRRAAMKSSNRESNRRTTGAENPSHAALDPSRAVDESSIEAPRAGELLVVVGPTATGKTELAIDLAGRFGGEIVSAGSVQVYRAFELGTGKPSRDELARAAHHLVDVMDPLEPVDARRWAELADAAIASIRERGKTPIVC